VAVGEGILRKQSTGFSITATDRKSTKKTTINRLSMQRIVIIGIARQDQKWQKYEE